MRRFRMTIVLAVATLLFISICSAQQTTTTAVPNLIRYSGTLKDMQSALTSGTAVGVTFAIYKQQDGGAAVWQETQNVTPDASGQYSVILGSTTATGMPDGLFSQQEQRWLGVQIQGQDEQARVLLVSVPYAFKAHEAETLGGLPPTAFVKAPQPGTVGGIYGNGTAANAPGAVGNSGSKADSAPVNPPTVSDCLNPILGAITLWSKQIQINPPIWELCNSNLVQVLDPTNVNFGNIGIGTPNPSEKLDVNGAINAWRWYDIGPGELAFAGIGFNALPTKRNTFVGVGAGTSNPLLPPATPPGETDNTFLGYYAGSNTRPNFVAFSGSYNTFIGTNAGLGNTFGSYNNFMGESAGLHNTESGNTFIGAAAGYSNTTGHENNFSGFEAGVNNTTGSYNNFSGFGAGVNNATGSNNVYLANFGLNESNTIRIGMMGTDNLQQNRVFIEPILLNPTNATLDAVTINGAGQLGHTPFPIGGGVSGNCNQPGPDGNGTNYITKWLNPTTVQCSSIFENTTAAPIGPQVGIGTTTFKAVNPGKLEVVYTDTTAAYPSVLRLHNLGPLNFFTQTGILFSTVNDYDTARVYATLDCSSAGVCERITLQTAYPGGIYLDTLSVKNAMVGIGTINPAATLDVNGMVRVQNLPAVGPSPHVCFNTVGGVSNILTNCQNADEEQIKTLQDQIQSLQKQNEELQQRLSRLESLIEKK